MKQLSALELRYLAGELSVLAGARLDNVYSAGKNGFDFQFFVKNKGRIVLKVRLPGLLFLSDNRGQADFEPKVSGILATFRQNLRNCTLKGIFQIGFERILRLDFASKNTRFSLFFEFFGKGNLILVKDGKIVNSSLKQSFGLRSVRPGEPHKLPPALILPDSLSESALAGMLKSSSKTDIVRFFAIELGLGGLYAEELCLRAGLDRSLSPSSAASSAKAIIEGIKSLFAPKPSPSVILDSATAVDAVPFRIEKYKSQPQKEADTFSRALEMVYSSSGESPSKNRELERLELIIQKQKEALEQASAEIAQTSRQGELIYEHYQEIRQVLDAFKEGGWKKVLKLPAIKSLDEKNGNIVLEF